MIHRGDTSLRQLVQLMAEDTGRQVSIRQQTELWSELVDEPLA